ncbi:MAG: DUF2310 family Zn-ribbon-containing protein [Planctomycetota bacterium]
MNLNPVDENDPFRKLRVLPPTPEDELCQCSALKSLILQDRLGPNPLMCLECRGEVAPERVRFPAVLVEDISRWQAVHSSLYRLWLDSSQYEDWAKTQLMEPDGQVNRIGYEIVRQLNELPHVTIYYRFFADTDSDSDLPEICPRCRNALERLFEGERGTCESCKIVA